MAASAISQRETWVSCESSSGSGPCSVRRSPRTWVGPLSLVLAVERSHSREAAKLVAALSSTRRSPAFADRGRGCSGAGTRRSSSHSTRSTIFACGVVEEASTHDSRLALGTVRAAHRAGAVTLNYTQARQRSSECAPSAQSTVVDGVTGEHLTVHSRAVVNASGPWVDRVRLLEDPRARPLTRLSKGVHAVLPLPDGWQCRARPLRCCSQRVRGSLARGSSCSGRPTPQSKRTRPCRVCRPTKMGRRCSLGSATCCPTWGPIES